VEINKNWTLIEMGSEVSKETGCQTWWCH